MKKYYIYTVIFAALISFGLFIYLSLKPPIYKSSGKFSLLVTTQTLQEAKNPYADVTLNKTITESIKTRYFIKKLYADAKVQITETEMTNIEDIIDASIIDDSNILEVGLFSKNKNNLSQINDVFFSTLEKSGILTAGKTEIQIKIIEPFQIEEKPISPQTLKYCGVTFLAVILLGSLLIYTFYLPEYYKFLSE